MKTLQPHEFVTINPLDGPECVIVVAHIYELNGPWKEDPASIYFRDPSGAIPQGKQDISVDEYERLKLLLSGEATVPTVEEFEEMKAKIKEAYGKANEPVEEESEGAEDEETEK